MAMDSTSILSPPTSRARAAISVVEVTTMSFLASAAVGVTTAQNTIPARSATIKYSILCLFLIPFS
jgi:hypothetical protein